MRKNNTLLIGLAIPAILIGIYPFLYPVLDMRHHGLLQSKSNELLDSYWYNFFFYIHIAMGGLALLTGWTQFNSGLRARKINLHRFTGKVYLLAVLCSSLAGFAIAFFATGGLISTLGFGTLALVWLISNIQAYAFIRKRNIPKHRNWMIRNYALTFAAVTLRIYLPLSALLNLPGLDAYRAISWLCWVPNLFFAEFLISRQTQYI
ncbi:DUF2306 domain-containing protein [Flavitalea flava]